MPRSTRVFGWLADAAGCGYYRIAQPLSNLPRDRFAPEASNQIEHDFWQRFDVVIGQRVAKDGASQTWQRVCADPDVKAIYELDDDFWALHESNPAHSFFNEPGVQARMEANVAAAQVVTVSTEPLAERVRQWNPNVVVIPNFIDARVLSLPRPEQAEETVTVGWAGSPTHGMDWAVAQREITRVICGETSARMGFIGASFPAGLPRDKTRWVPWQEDMHTYYNHLAWTFDVGIAPLAHHPFNRSKSHIKALEYAAAGIPIVASDEEPYRGFVKHGETGFLVKQDHEWGVYLRKLIKDRDLRVTMGEAARKHAAKWTIQGNIGAWAKVLTA
jgi:glycosyltransferase involved in cell wall biosynthesis